MNRLDSEDDGMEERKEGYTGWWKAGTGREGTKEGNEERRKVGVTKKRGKKREVQMTQMFSPQKCEIMDHRFKRGNRQ